MVWPARSSCCACQATRPSWLHITTTATALIKNLQWQVLLPPFQGRGCVNPVAQGGCGAHCTCLTAVPTLQAPSVSETAAPPTAAFSPLQQHRHHLHLDSILRHRAHVRSELQHVGTAHPAACLGHMRGMLAAAAASKAPKPNWECHRPRKPRPQRPLLGGLPAQEQQGTFG